MFLLANNGDHPQKTITEKDERGEKVERRVCSAYGVPTCSDHKRNWKRVFQEHSEGEDMKVPALIVLMPDGSEHDRIQAEIENSEAVDKVKKARALAGPSLSKDELLEVKGKLDAGQSAEKTRFHHSAWHAYARILEITEKSSWADLARAGRDRALEAMQREIDEALAWMEEGRVIDGYERLLARQKDYGGTPLAKSLGATIKKAERNKAWKDAIDAYKQSLAAEELWAKVQEALDAGKTAIAERHAKKLLKKYAHTPAAKRAAERFPELVGG